MDKGILSEYMDACAMIKETEQEIKKLKARKTVTVEDVVRGSNECFPYQPRNFHISGTVSGSGTERKVRRQEQILEERRERAEEIKAETESWMNTIPMRMQRIIKYKIFEEMSWEEAAVKIGRRATGEGIREEFERFFA